MTKARQFRGFRKSLTVINSRNMKKKKFEKQEGLNQRGFVSKAQRFRDFAKILYFDEHNKKKNPKQFSLPLLLLLKFPIPCSSCVSVETSPSTGCNCSNKHKASMMLLVKRVSSQMLEHSVIMTAASSAWEGHES
jgi:hypothetical protein